MTPAIICTVAATHDGDTIRCTDGTRIRIGGIEANELHGGCHLTHCAPMPARQAKAYLARLVLNRRLTCRPLGTSYRRVVATCRVNGVDVGCRLVAVGAAVEWRAYRRRYGMGECR